MRLVIWSLMIVLALTPVATLLSSPEASPEVSVRKPYLSHAARLETTIPIDWIPDRSLAHNYAGESGFIASWSLGSPWGLPDLYLTLDEGCEIYLDAYGGERTPREVDGMPSCLIEPLGTGDDQPVFVVITHPDPQGSQGFVVVTTNRGSLEQILETLTFDLNEVSPQLYLDAALDVISVRSLQRDLIDWKEIRADAQLSLTNVSPEQGFQLAQAVLREVIGQIVEVGGDGHNIFMSAEEVDSLGAYMNSPSQETLPIVMPNEPAPGMVKIIVPRFANTSEAGKRYVELLWNQLEAAVDESTCGIVVDLTSNRGGNMYPMLQGLGPLIGEGPVLGFTDAAGTTLQVSMNAQYQLAQQSKSAEGQTVVEGVSNTLYTPDRPAPDLSGRDLAVAVIIGPMTVSAGEATAIGLREVDFPVMFFGESTAGYATSGFSLPLIDGAMVRLSDLWTTTVDGETFPDGVPPDVEVDGWNESGEAEEWIRETARC